MHSEAVLVIIFSITQTFICDSTGGHGHHHDHHGKTSSNHIHDVKGKSLSNIADIDYQMYHVLQSIPLAIQEARESLSQSTRETNVDKTIVGLACLAGAVSGGLDVTSSATSGPTLGSSLGFAAQHAWGYGYWAPFLLDLQDLDPGCGVEDFNEVLSQYSFVTSLYSVYDSNVGQGAYSSGHPDDRPELRAYYMGEFGRKAKLALHCIVSQVNNFSSRDCSYFFPEITFHENIFRLEVIHLLPKLEL